MDDIEEIGLLLKAAMRESDRRINNLLRSAGLTASQAEALQLLARRGPMSLGELGSLLVAEGGHPSRLVDRMVRAGLVARESAAEDRRRIDLVLTEKGRRLAAEAQERKEEFHAWVGGQLHDLDLEPVRKFFTAYLNGTALAQTVRLRRSLGGPAG